MKIYDDKHIKNVAFVGAHNSGKTTLAADLCSKIGHDSAVVLNVDDWWQYNRAEMKALNLTGYDWAARDEKRFLRELGDLKNGTSINKPFQDYHNESPSENSEGFPLRTPPGCRWRRRRR